MGIIALNAYIKKEEISQVIYTTLSLKELGKKIDYWHIINFRIKSTSLSKGNNHLQYLTIAFLASPTPSSALHHTYRHSAYRITHRLGLNSPGFSTPPGWGSYP